MIHQYQMTQQERLCNQKGHEEYSAAHICTYLNCDLSSRWVCCQCMADNLHQHGTQAQSYIKNKQEIIQLLNTNNKQILKSISYQQGVVLSIISKVNQKISNLIKVIKELQEQVQGIMYDFQSQYQQDKLKFSELQQQDILKLSNEQLDDYLKVNNTCFYQMINFNKIDIELDSIHKVSLEIKQDFKNLLNQCVGEIRNCTFSIQDIDVTNHQFNTAQISQDEKYLCYGGNEKLLKIYDLRLQKQIKAIQLNYLIYCSQFSNDSTNLYIGCNFGQFLIFDCLNNFNRIKRIQIHESGIYHILCVQNSIITASSDLKIIKTDLNLDQQLFKINAHRYSISYIEYDFQNNVIISCSDYSSIKFWDGLDGRILIDKQLENTDNIIKIQFIRNNQLYSLDNQGNLKLWNVQYNQKNIFLFKELKFQDSIIDFQLMYNNMCLVTILEKQVKIMNYKGEQLQKFKHTANDNGIDLNINKQLVRLIDSCISGNQLFDCKQLDNLNFILIRSQNKIQVAKKTIQLLTPAGN
ncbi:WD repeat-containing protein 6 [Paramecium bursaria]